MPVDSTAFEDLLERAKNAPEQVDVAFDAFVKQASNKLQAYQILLQDISQLQKHCKSKALEPVMHRLISWKGHLYARLAENAIDHNNHHQAFLFYQLSKAEFEKNMPHHSHHDKAAHQMTLRMFENFNTSIRYDAGFNHKKTLEEIRKTHPLIEDLSVKPVSVSKVGLWKAKPDKPVKPATTVKPKGPDR